MKNLSNKERKGLTRFIPKPLEGTQREVEFEIITDIEVIRNISEGLKNGSSKKTTRRII